MRQAWIGFAPQVVELDLTRNCQLAIELEPATEELEEIEVIAERDEEIQASTQMSAVEVPVEQIQRMPALWMIATTTLRSLANENFDSLRRSSLGTTECRRRGCVRRSATRSGQCWLTSWCSGIATSRGSRYGEGRKLEEIAEIDVHGELLCLVFVTDGAARAREREPV